MANNLNVLYGLRKNIVKKEDGKTKFLLANFSGSKQKIDIEKRNFVIEDFFRIKIDVKPWRDAEDTRKDNSSFDWNNKENIMASMAQGFDMPSWALYKLKRKKELTRELNNYCEVFIDQLKGCNENCSYCFVDDFNKNGKQDNGAEYFSMDEIVDAFEKERASRKFPLNVLNRIRVSGGEPTIAPEKILDLLKEIKKRGLDNEVHIQSDTNLTSGHFIEAVERKSEMEKNILEKIAEYPNIGLLCSFKGTDRINFSRNTRAEQSLFDEQLYSFKKLVKAGIDAYPFFYNPNPETLEGFMENLSREVGENVYLKTWVFPLKVYEPIKERLGNKADLYQKEWNSNFEKSEEIMKTILQKKFNVEYKKQLRAGIELKVKN